MPSKKTRISRRKIKGKRHRHIFLILIFILTAIFFLHKEFSKDIPQPQEDTVREVVKKTPPKKEPEALPKIVVIIDDLGPSKKAAVDILKINAPFTFSILPHETYSGWIAEKAHSFGYDIIGHIPMEAIKPHKLGKGGLYTWMTDNEILETLNDDLDSIPYLKGISNHMGSAFTRDKRSMSLVISGLKDRGLFFLDSLTSSSSIGFRLAKERGLMTIKRDVFLDNKNDTVYIEARWKELIKIARQKGYAIGIAHAKKNTIRFLQKALPGNQVTVVPLSEIIVNTAKNSS